jgi:peptidoglycan/LPS O-acetylase OafA/YrhL
MTKDRLPEIDILRIVSILIVVLLIHVPQNYAYNFYLDLDLYGVFFINHIGIYVAMGSFVFVSGFGLYLNSNYRKINSREKLISFLKKRFLRIFPLYWIALILFVIFLGYTNIDPLYALAHVLGLQIMVAPLFGPPMLTLWFIGIIVIYYLIFVVFGFLGSVKRIIPASLAILFFFVFLNGFFDLVELRFFLYYLMFIAGIIAAGIYTSPPYNRVKESLKKIPWPILLIIPLCTAVICLFLFLFLCQFCYSTFILDYGTFSLDFIIDMNPGFFPSALAVLLINIIMLTFITFAFSLFNFFIRTFRMIFPKRKIESIISVIAYSTLCVYLFHRIFLIIFDYILIERLNIDIFDKENFYLVVLYIPFIFLFSYLIQRASDWVLKLPSRLKSRKLLIDSSSEHRS